jgi:hypothetical protein
MKFASHHHEAFIWLRCEQYDKSARHKRLELLVYQHSTGPRRGQRLGKFPVIDKGQVARLGEVNRRDIGHSLRVVCDTLKLGAGQDRNFAYR